MSSSEMYRRYAFGGFVLDPARRLLLRTDGEQVAITAKAFDALVYLVQHAGEVVSRAHLSDALWPNTVVEDNNLSQTILALRRVLGDSESGPRYIVTVPRRGYQFVAPVDIRDGPASSKERDRTQTIGPSFVPPSRKRVALVAGILMLAAGAGIAGLIYASRTREPQASVAGVRAQTVAVLPFENLSPKPEDAYFAAGMHEEVLSRLAKVRDVAVVARTSVMHYTGERAHSIPAIAADLGVAAVMEGSVRFSDNRVRVSVRLVEGSSARELWAETYDAELQDVFDIQSDIATRIVAALESELSPAEARTLTAKPTRSTQAYALYLKALVLYRSSGSIGVSMTAETRQTIRRHLDEALALDPSFSTALGWRAQLAIDSMNFDAFPAAEREARMRALIATVEHDAHAALAADPTLGIAHAALARLHTFQYELDDALAALRRAQQLTPRDPLVWQAAAVLHCVRNEAHAALAAADRAIELDPRNPGPYSLRAIALRVKGEYVQAIAAYERMIELAPTAVIGYVGLARTLTSQGDTPKLRETLQLAEQFLGAVRSFRLDLALSYASIDAHSDAARLVAEFKRDSEGHYVDPALVAMSHLALGEYAQAQQVLRDAIAAERRGMDQMPLTLIRYNAWADSTLEQPEWIELRNRLEYREKGARI